MVCNRLASERDSLVLSRDQAQDAAHAKIQVLEGQVNSLNRWYSKLQRSLDDEVSRREATATAVEENEKSLREQLATSQAHLEEAQHQLRDTDMSQTYL